MRLLALSAALLTLAACGTDDAPPAEPAPAAEPAPPADRSAARDVEAVVGGPSGLGVFAGDGEPTEVAFEAPQSEVLGALAVVFGAPDREEELAECGAGPLLAASWDTGLTLYFGDGALAGWLMEGEDERLQAAAGVQLGTPVDVLTATPGYEAVEDSTLGPEFGIVDGEGYVGGLHEDGVVTMLWAGANCFMR